MSALRLALAILLVVAGRAAADNGFGEPDSCDTPGLKLQVLGSGGPALRGGRAASGHLIWIDGKARVLLDMGTGTALRFQESGARAADLDVVLFTHLHASRTLDFPALVGIAIREEREHPLPVYGPTGNRLAPSTVTFVRTLLDGTRGAYRHLGGVLSPLTKDGLKLRPHDVRERRSRVGARRGNPEILSVYANPRVTLKAAYVAHGGVPALAWRVNAGDRSIAFTGGAKSAGPLERLARNADVLVADDAVAGGADTAEGRQHMTPSAIGRLAAAAGVKRVVLVRRTPQTLGKEAATLAAIRARYAGPVVFADDLACLAVP